MTTRQFRPLEDHDPSLLIPADELRAHLPSDLTEAAIMVDEVKRAHIAAIFRLRLPRETRDKGGEHRVREVRSIPSLMASERRRFDRLDAETRKLQQLQNELIEKSKPSAARRRLELALTLDRSSK